MPRSIWLRGYCACGAWNNAVDLTMSRNTNAPSLGKGETAPAELTLQEFARRKAASQRASKYSIASEKGPCDRRPSAEAEDNLPIMGSPVSDMADMDPISGYLKVANVV